MLDKKKYRAEIVRLYAEMDVAQKRIDEIDDYDEWVALDDEIAEKYLPRIVALEKAEDQIARSSQPRSEFFIRFCKSLKHLQMLTQKQYAAFTQYAKETTSKTSKQYSTIVDGNRYYTVGRQIFVEPVALL